MKRTIAVVSLLYICHSVLAQREKIIDKINTLSISIQFEKPVAGADTLILAYDEGGLYYSMKGLYKERFTRIQKKTKTAKGFVFIMDSITKPGYIVVFAKSSGENNKTIIHKKILENYLVLPGDEINISATEVPGENEKRGDRTSYKLSFRGNAGSRMECIQELQEINRIKSWLPDRKSFDANMNVLRSMREKAAEEDLAIAEKYKDKMDVMSYGILVEDMYRLREYEQWKYLLTVFATDPAIRPRLRLLTDELQMERVIRSDTNSFSIHSMHFINAIFSRFYLECSIDVGGRSFNVEAIPWKIVQNYSGELRDKLLAIFFANRNTKVRRTNPAVYQNVASIMGDNRYKGMVLLASTISPGSTAFDFELVDDKGKTIRMRDFYGKIVFLDFWFTGCTACSAYYKKILHDAEIKYKNDKEVVFISISIDADREKWLKSVRLGEYTSSNAINLYTQGQGSYHPAIAYYDIQGYPQPMLIDRNGIIRSISNLRKSKEDLVAQIEALRGGK